MAHCVFQIIHVLIIQLWLSPLISSKQNDEELDCIPSIMVPRNTVWIVREMKPLSINCTITVNSHCWKNISASWCRIDDDNQCRPLIHFNRNTMQRENTVEHKRMLFLLFQNITMQDTGLYRCEINSPTPSVSHAINVTVTDYVPDDVPTDYKIVSQENDTTNSLNPSTKKKDYPLSYVYIGSGVGALLLIVAVVSVIVICCRGKKIHEDQSTASPTADPAPPIYKPRKSPRSKTQTLPVQLSPPPLCIYDSPPVRMMSLRSSPGRRPVKHGPQGRSHDRGTADEVEEEDPLIYATLNHDAVPQRPVRVDHVQIEASEYAAIKVT